LNDTTVIVGHDQSHKSQTAINHHCPIEIQCIVITHVIDFTLHDALASIGRDRKEEMEEREVKEGRECKNVKLSSK